jgi:RNA-directed DNA polymerase
MPKSYNHFFDKIVAWENLHRAFMAARQGKRYAPAVLRFQKNLEENLVNIQNHLIWGSWTPGRWHEFMVYDPKRRFIQAPPFEDRVVHHALVNIIDPLFEKKFINDSYACRSGRGFHQAAYRVQSFLRKANRSGERVYVLKADISQYFPSIDHDVLLAIIKRTIRDRQVLDLCETIIRKSGMDGKGIPVGALTSQLFANVYLDQLDHYIKDDLGIKMYCRYMDDFIVIAGSKQELWDIYDLSKAFIENCPKLSLNPKTDIFPGSHGVDFCGYRVWSTHILPRRRTVKKARKNLTRMASKCTAGLLPLRKVRESIMSFLGYMRHCSGHVTASKILLQTSVTRRQK